MSILKRLGLGSGLAASSKSPGNPFIARIQEELSHLPPQRTEMVAAFAGLLVRVAHADSLVSEDERSSLPGLIAEHSNLSDSEAVVVAEIATQYATGFEGIEYSALTRAFNGQASPEEKENLLDCLFAVAATHGISVEEEEEVRAVSRAILVPHLRFIEIRQRYREHRDVIQGLPSQN